MSYRNVLIVVLTFALSAIAPAQQSDDAAVHASTSRGVPHASPLGVGASNATFRVKYVASDVVYVEGGRAAGLREGTALVIKGALPPNAKEESTDGADAFVAVAQLKVVSVAETSAVCEIVSSTRPIVAGDVASLTSEEIEKDIEKNVLSNTRRYPAVVSFTEGDPLDEEVRDFVPRPPLPEVNRASGRIGFDYSSTSTLGPFGSSSRQLGLVLRTDITRINGTYWNLSGYWRGTFNSNSSQTQTLQDLMNRTYHLTLTYANPNSRWVAGFGRMYLPWAASLDTVDGGYFGRRLSQRVTAGIFAGTTPDPTSWSYDPNRRIGGSFINFDGGSFDAFKYSSTFGFGLSMTGWQIDRPFVFADNTFSYKQFFSFYHSFQVDRPTTNPLVPAVGTGLSRSFLSMRFQANKRVSFDLNHNYFRDVPTFDPQLVGTGLLDKYLFQGFSGGARIQFPRRVTFYTNIGRSNTNRDTRSSWNTMYGVTVGRIWRTGLDADLRYSRFNSSFASGSYHSFSLSRNVGDTIRAEAEFGTQSFVSSLTRDTGSHFFNARADINLRAHFFLETGFTLQRGGAFNYNQWYTTCGYRFDNRSHRKEAADAATAAPTGAAAAAPKAATAAQGAAIAPAHD